MHLHVMEEWKAAGREAHNGIQRRVRGILCTIQIPIMGSSCLIYALSSVKLFGGIKTALIT